MATERMDIESAYREVGTFRGAAEICATTPKTVKRVVLATRRNGEVKETPHNYDQVRDLVAARVEKTKARISAKRLLPVARSAGYGGSARNFRRLVADEKAAWRTGRLHARRRLPAVARAGWGILAAPLVSSSAQEGVDLCIDGLLHEQADSETADVLEDARQVLVGGERFVDLCADARCGRYSLCHGRGSSFVS